jgi:hypothetical protein
MATLTQIGFDVVTKRPCFLGENTPLLSESLLGPRQAFQAPDNPGIVIKADSAADVRAKPPSGMFPASDMRYRAYVEILPAGGDNGAFVSDLSAKALTLTGGFSPFVFTDATIEKSTVIFAVVGFEGVDVFDMPESEFERVSEGIKIPDRFKGIYKVIHAGAEPLIPENDENGKQFWSTVGPYLESNLSIGTTLNYDAPFDVRSKFEESGDPLFADTSSRIIRTRGDVNFISFVGITNHIFRDVVIMRGASKTESIGLLGNAFQTQNREALTSDDRAQVLRFLWNDNPSANDPGLERPRWDLSETFTIQPESSWEGDAEGVSGNESDPFSPSDRFIYNQFETTFPSVKGTTPVRVLRKGYPEEFANTAVGAFDINAPTLVQDFKIERIRIDEDDSELLISNEQRFFLTGQPQLFRGTGILCGTSIARSARNHSFLFTSSKITENVSGTFRIGHEYFDSLRFGQRFSASDFVLLVRTGPPGSIAASYDKSTGDTDCIDATESGNIKIRKVQDVRWSTCRDLPVSEFKGKFILGEFPYKTDGGSAVIQRGTRVSVSGTKIEINDDEVIIALGLDVRKDINGDGRGTFKLFNLESDDTPEVEFTLFDVAPESNGILRVTVSPGKYEKFEPGGGFFGASFVVVVKEDEVIQEKPSFPDISEDDSGKPWVEPSKTQFRQIPELSVAPESEQSGIAEGRSVSLVNIPKNGFNIGAYENDGRINLMVRGPGDSEYSVIRDVILRVQNEEEEESDSESEEPSLPSASTPNVIFDPASEMLMIFYLYKGVLLVKRIPVGIITDLVERQGGRVTVESESVVIQRMHSVLASIVYDYDRTGHDILANDAMDGVVLVDPNKATVADDPPGIQAHTAFVDDNGVTHIFIEEENNIVALKSPDGGTTWQRTFDDRFFVYPVVDGDEENPSDIESIGDSDSDVVDAARFPYVMFDRASGQCSLFFFVDEFLLVTEFPVQILKEEPEDATELFMARLEEGPREGESKTRIIFGTPNPTINVRKFLTRGIGLARNDPSIDDLEEEEEDPDALIGGEEEDETEEDTEEKAIPQRIAAIWTQQGQRRVFFKDTNRRLRSLTSSDATKWRLDENFAQERTQ